MVETPEDCVNMEAFVAWMGEIDPDEIGSVSAGRLPGLLAITWQKAWAASRDYERQQSDEYQRGYADGYEAGYEAGEEAGAEAALEEDEGMREARVAALTSANARLTAFAEDVRDNWGVLTGWDLKDGARAALAAAAEGATVERATDTSFPPADSSA